MSCDPLSGLLPKELYLPLAMITAHKEENLTGIGGGGSVRFSVYCSRMYSHQVSPWKLKLRLGLFSVVMAEVREENPFVSTPKSRRVRRGSVLPKIGTNSKKAPGHTGTLFLFFIIVATFRSQDLHLAVRMATSQSEGLRLENSRDSKRKLEKMIMREREKL